MREVASTVSALSSRPGKLDCATYFHLIQVCVERADFGIPYLCVTHVRTICRDVSVRPSSATFYSTQRRAGETDEPLHDRQI